MTENTLAQTEGYFVVDGYVLLPYFDREKLQSRAVDKFKFRPSDVIVAGFPKSGSTWLIEVLKAMYNDWGLQKFGETENAFLFEERTVFSSFFSMKHEELVQKVKCEDAPSPRLMRTHLPATLFPCHLLKDKGVKVIHVCRNPKDVVVSTYYFWKRFLHGAYSTGDWEETIQAFLDDRLPFTPWVRHVGDWLQKGNEHNVLQLTYENMKEDLPGSVKKIATFLQRPLTAEDFARVVRVTTVDFMRNRLSKMVVAADEMMPKGENPYVRKGIVGDWKNHFTVAQNERFDSVIGEKVRSTNKNIPYQ